MKRLLLPLLALSLLVNAGLLVAPVLRRGKLEVPTVVAPPAPAPNPLPVEPPAKLWDRLQGGEARELAARLRAAGAPERTVRLLVADALRERYLARQRELIGDGDPAAFWQEAAAATDREKQAALRALARKNEDVLAELFGADPATAEARERRRRLYGPLPDAKLERIDRLTADYGDMADDIRAQAGGVLLASDRELLALLEQERRKDVAAILTPAELDIYDLMTSATARTLRARLANFAPSEREFRALFALQRDFDARFAGSNGAGDEASRRERAAAEAELDGRIKSALGATRYEEYRRQQDPGYRVVARIVERFGLPAKRADEVVGLALNVRTRLRALRDDPGLTPEAVRGELEVLTRESGERILALLGSDGAELYRRTSGGAWLRALERVAAEPAAHSPDSAARAEPAPPAASAAATDPSGAVSPPAAPAGTPNG